MKKQMTKDNENLSSSPKFKNEKESKENLKEITLEYKLHELPSSQHKAGLAGLYLIIDWLDKQDINKELIKRTQISEAGLKVTLTKKDVKDLFDEIYKPIFIRVEDDKIRTKGKGENKKDIPPLDLYSKKFETKIFIYPSKPKAKLEPNKVLIQEIDNPNPSSKKNRKLYIYEEETKKKRKYPNNIDIEPIKTYSIEEEKIVYIYDDKYPFGSFLSQYDKNKENGLWIKLWRDMMWSTIRGIPTTRNEYKKYESENDPNIIKQWKILSSLTDFKTLKSQYFIGAQKVNAESINFQDIHKHFFLLNFFPFTIQTYASRKMEYDSNIKDYKLADNGYIVCIPDILRLKSFCEYFPDYMNQRSLDKAGYRPREAITFLPQIAGLDSLNKFHLILKRTLGNSFHEILHAQDIIHCEKDDKNIRIRNSIRIKPNFDFENKVMQYKKLYHNYHFQKEIIQNLLSNKSELNGFYELFKNYPYEEFFKFGANVRGEIGFKTDAKTYFEEQEIKFKGEQKMSEDGNVPKTIELLVHQIIRTYIFSKLEFKHQIIWDKDKKVLWSKSRNTPANDDDYKNKSKIAKDAFLAIRSRKDREDFINYFTSTICSVPHKLGEEEYIKLAESLYNAEEDTGWEKIRALSMLALSANS
ncbi:type I-MYXAN CRISPR-associated protein Cmx8 [Leptospira kirschneri]|uniref:type I-MYXAN CRISPR-associated protein Cmx8 n=1 Tax=Leptospira kirschneri TaxID=29507 RepID=UPI0002784A40|nr:type I-MYXAN CRISPR-associated protein Cmx8 [Leptospira kirschneri]EJO68285.1 hypothetical protein LEP1GSC044_0021 [Leptospira kirschneri serovar Grippotyphosa str. RM52]EKQ85000.1 hypothetical protein LEP1GSC064_1752 [Leptospira kirschneri serovar Grippotyphosa str. Moskva]EKR08030.1 hypothetical protein LEP1GSC122_2394 [Leptospira kirschneri serovar Valbuzzi str. 200702274]EMK02768.1 hypothetical protein LEP1GSC176_0644 [Leptospira kirschneri str. MMD1493]EMN26933.1 hypothetical protein L